MDNKIKKVSVIIPAYNVENYIAQCLESVCTQSYSELEILVIYDRCGDNTLAICQDWERRDSRIRLVINEVRCGLGEARNIGLRLAAGEYVMYLDSDDWYAPDCVEKLLTAIEETDADYVSYSGIFWNQGDTVKLKSNLPAGEYTTDLEKKFVLLREFPAVWKKIYRRKWLIDNALFQPQLFCYEDWGYNMSLVLNTSKIVLIPGAGVYYRVAREGSLSMDPNLNLVKEFGKAVKGGIEAAIKKGILETYKKTFLMYFFRDYCMLKKKSEDSHKQETLELLEVIRKDVVENLLGFQNLVSFKRHITFGSFSCKWVVSETGIFLENLEHYGFSSMIAAMTMAECNTICHKNTFRKIQVEQDMTGKFARELERLEERTLLVLDFMEELNSIQQSADGNFYTVSEAWRETDGHGLKAAKTVPCRTDLYYTLWEKKITELVNILEQKQELLETVLLKNRLSFQYGDLNGRKMFDNAEQTAERNNWINRLEQVFLEKCRTSGVHVRVMEMPGDYMFTDKNFEYGCEPQYMNKALYTYMGMEMVSEYIGKS